MKFGTSLASVTQNLKRKRVEQSNAGRRLMVAESANEATDKQKLPGVRGAFVLIQTPK